MGKKSTAAPGKGIFLRGNIYWLRFSRDGKQQFVSLQTADPVAAVTRATLARGATEFKPRVGLEREIEKFVLAKKAQSRFTSRQTELWIRRALAKLVNFFPGKSARDFTRYDMEQFAANLKATMAETGAMSYLRGIKSFFSWAKDENLRFDNPCKGLVRTPRNAARLLFATKEKRDSLIAAMEAKRVSQDAAIRATYHEPLHLALFCAFHTGMRFHEIIEARHDWFNLDDGYVTIQNTDTFKTKNRCARTVPLTAPFKKFLQRYGLRKPFMLAPDVVQGRGIYRYDFRSPWTEHCEALGLAWITPHVARHTFASLLVQSGVSIFKVAKWMGHGVLVCEKHYAHLAPGDTGIDKML